jgi:hypothetical protein
VSGRGTAAAIAVASLVVGTIALVVLDGAAEAEREAIVFSSNRDARSVPPGASTTPTADGTPSDTTTSVALAKAELVDAIQDVTGATAFRWGRRTTSVTSSTR